jgi:hypothetical protein
VPDHVTNADKRLYDQQFTRCAICRYQARHLFLFPMTASIGQTGRQCASLAADDVSRMWCCVSTPQSSGNRLIIQTLNHRHLPGYR